MIQIEHLNKTYNTVEGAPVEAIVDLSLNLPNTGMVFLLGKSGSGKSTLLHLLGGLDSPTSGQMIINGQSTLSFTSQDYDLYRNTYVGYVFQDVNLIEQLNVYENVALSLELKGEKASREVVLDALRKVELDELADRRTNELSGGQKQRVAIARAFVKNPQLILADEPTGALDSETGKVVFSLLKQLSREKLVVVASHDRESAEKFGDRVIEIQDGRITSDTCKGVIAEKTAEYSPIKPKLPLVSALKIAFSSLKRKKFKFVSSILLAGVAFSMFGVFASLMMVDESGVLAKGYKDVTVAAIPTRKCIEGVKAKKVAFDEYGEQSYSFDAEPMYGTVRVTCFSKKELDSLNKRGANAAGVFVLPEAPSGAYFSQFEIGDNLWEYYRTGLYSSPSCVGINGFSDCGEEYCNKHFELEAGRYPETATEIAISAFKADALIASQTNQEKKTFAAYDDIIDSKIAIGFTDYQLYSWVTVVGIYKTNEVPSRFDSLKTFPGNLDQELSLDFCAFKQDSFMDIAFVSDDFYDTYVCRYDTDKYSIQGVGLSSSIDLEGDADVDQFSPAVYETKEHVGRVVPSEFLKDRLDDAHITDLEGNPLNELDLGDNEIIVSDGWKDEVEVWRYRALLNDVGKLGRLTPMTNFNNCLFIYSREAFDECASDEIIQCEEYYLDKVPTASSKTNIDDPELRKAYQRLNEMVERHFDICSKRAFLFNTVKRFGYKKDGMDDEILKKLYEVNWSAEELDWLEGFLQKVRGAYYDMSKVADFPEEDWDELEQLMDEHYDDTIALYNAMKSFSLFMPYQTAVAVYGEEKRSEEFLPIVEKINTMFHGSYSAMQEAFMADTLSSEVLQDICRVVIMVYEESERIADYEYGHFGKRSACPKSYDLVDPTTNKKYKTVGFLSDGVTKIRGTIIANPATLKSLSVGISKNSSIYLEESDYQYTGDGKYTFLLSAGKQTSGLAGLLNERHKTYRYYTDDRVSQNMRGQIDSLRFVKPGFAIAGVVFGFFSTLLLISVIQDSIRGSQKEIGVLRSMGARPLDIFKMFSAESILITFISIILANVIGALMVFWANSYSVVDKKVTPIFEYGPLTVLIVFALASIVALFALALPIRKKCKQNTIDVIKG